MDGETKAYLDGMMLQINTKLDNIIDKMSAIRQDAETTQGQVLYGLQGNLTLSQRITKREDEMRKRP